MKTFLLFLGVFISGLFAYLQYKVIKENLDKVSADVDEVKEQVTNILS